MTGMDLSTRRAAPGISVFWYIVGLGALVTLLIALAIVLTERTLVESGADPELLRPSTDAEVGVVGPTVPDIETPVDSANFEFGPETDAAALVDRSEDRFDAPPPGVTEPLTLDLVIDPDRLDAMGADILTPREAETLGESPVLGPVPAPDAVLPGGTVTEDEYPVPGASPVYPKPVGPEGSDDNPLTPD